ncbi:hypothetical protein DPX16_13695 [Anabarilius grahami]|uniref:Uncharacterized protein n=1 Tax=Anabarilius grahami TaxID=495550 RepID=A0A3N0XU07_ANAGA|nr:hypothetical protein DPX16_13695 [Anabarilius grahami]
MTFLVRDARLRAPVTFHTPQAPHAMFLSGEETGVTTADYELPASCLLFFVGYTRTDQLTTDFTRSSLTTDFHTIFTHHGPATTTFTHLFHGPSKSQRHSSPAVL